MFANRNPAAGAGDGASDAESFGQNDPSVARGPFNNQGAAPSWRDDLKVHPAAEEFDLLEGEELDELVADIRENGLQHPIVRDTGGVILDGRNRLEACKIAGVQPTFETYTGEDPVAFIISANIHRRHLTKQRRAEKIVAVLAKRTEWLTLSQSVIRDGAGMLAGSTKDPLKAAALAEGAKHNISEGTIKRALAKARPKAGKKKSRPKSAKNSSPPPAKADAAKSAAIMSPEERMQPADPGGPDRSREPQPGRHQPARDGESSRAREAVMSAPHQQLAVVKPATRPISVSEAARRWNCCRATARKRLAQGRMPDLAAPVDVPACHPGDGPCTTWQQPWQGPLRPMRMAGGLLLAGVAIGLAGAGLLINLDYGVQLGRDHDAARLFGALSVAADALALCLPAAACTLWGDGRRRLSVVIAAARLRMVASPWTMTADGALTRTITAEDADAGT